MTVDVFTERLERVRLRFVSSLDGKIADAYAAIPNLGGSAPAAASAVGETYRVIHGLVGVGPTVGFPVTGRAAREVEDTLRQAQQAGRGLTDDEALSFKQRLDALRDAAKRELQAFETV